jgi:WD40 repeat protein
MSLSSHPISEHKRLVGSCGGLLGIAIIFIAGLCVAGRLYGNALPTDIPPTDIPPTDIPPTDILPTNIPPSNIVPSDILLSNTTRLGKEGFSDAALSPDGNTVALVGRLGIILHDVKTLAEIRFRQSNIPLSCIAWSPNEKQLAFGGGDNYANVWDTVTDQLLRTEYRGDHNTRVISVAWAPDGRRLARGAIAPYSDEIVIWDAETGQTLHTLSSSSAQSQTLLHSLPSTEHTGVLTSISRLSNTAGLASGSSGNSQISWGAETSQSLHALLGASKKVASVAWSPDGKQLATGVIFGHSGPVSNGFVNIWDMETGQNLRSIYHPRSVTSVAWSPDGRQLAFVSGGDHVVILDTETEELLYTLTADVISVTWSPDGRHLASGLGDGRVIIWDVEADKGLGALSGHIGSVYSVIWSPDGRRLFSMAPESLSIWDLTSLVE